MSIQEWEQLRIAAQALVDQLRLIHQDEQYKGVWSLAMIHGISYIGPTYESELEALTAALANAEGKTL